MQTCYNCGKQVPDETLICPDCGALVRRYTSAPTPAAQTAAVRPQPTARPLTDAGGRPHLYGGVKAWLIILCALSAYMAVTSLFNTLLARNPQIFEMMLSQPGMEALEPMFSLLIEELPKAVPLFISLALVYAAKSACHLWLLLRPRRRAFMTSILVSFVGLVCAFLLGGSLFVVLSFLDPLFTWRGLRPFWPEMPR